MLRAHFSPISDVPIVRLGDFGASLTLGPGCLQGFHLCFPLLGICRFFGTGW